MRCGFLCGKEVMRMPKSATKANEYRPTKAENRLLEALVNPDNMGKNVEEMCSVAEVAKNTYYKAMKKPDFVKLVNETTLELIKGKVSDVLNASYTFALTEKGFQDRKILLQMAGLLVEKTETTVNGNLNVNNPFSDLSVEELRKLASHDG